MPHHVILKYNHKVLNGKKYRIAFNINLKQGLDRSVSYTGRSLFCNWGRSLNYYFYHQITLCSMQDSNLKIYPAIYGRLLWIQTISPLTSNFWLISLLDFSESQAVISLNEIQSPNRLVAPPNMSRVSASYVVAWGLGPAMNF